MPGDAGRDPAGHTDPTGDRLAQGHRAPAGDGALPRDSHGMRPEVRMGNDIVRQFAHLGDDTAGKRAAEHMAKFWDDRMRDNLRDAVAADDPDATPALVVAERILQATRVEQAEFRKPSGG